VFEPAVGLIEIRSIARGMTVVDAVVKKAAVRIHVAHPISPGHYVLVFSGSVAEVEESLMEGLACAGDSEIGHVFLPAVHQSIPDALSGQFGAKPPNLDSLGIMETFNVASTILAADAACKAAPVELVQMRLGQGIGGKAFFVMTGELYDVEAAIDAARETAGANQFMEVELIARPHPDMLQIYR